MPSRPASDRTTGTTGSEETVAESVGRAVAATDEAPLDDRMLAATIAAVHDWAAATVAGASTRPPRLLATALGAGMAGVVPLVGTRGRADPTTAALINGTAAHSLELDDIYSPGLYHPGAPTIAAALAAAQYVRASGACFLRGVAMGYEVGNRIATAVNPAHYRNWHTTGTVGAIGAAVAVAAIADGGAEAVAHAIALATTMSAGLQQTFRRDAMGKPLHAGHAAQAGVIAGLAAGQGMTGALDILEGPAGLGAAMAGDVDWTPVRAPIEVSDLTVARTTVKPYPCCGHTFAAIDGALRLRPQIENVDAVDEIIVQSYETAITVAGIAEPSTGFEARFSIPYVVACALLHGAVGLTSFDGATLSDPALRALIPKVRIECSPDYQAAFPDRRGASVIITSGSRCWKADCPDRKGDPANPLTPHELRIKFDDLVFPVLGPERAARLYQEIAALADASDCGEIPFGSD